MATHAAVSPGINTTSSRCCRRAARRALTKKEFLGCIVRLPTVAPVGAVSAMNVGQALALASELVKTNYRSHSDHMQPALTPNVPINQSTSIEKSMTFEVFEGLGTSTTPVGICEVRSLPAAISLEEAMATLHSAIVKLQGSLPTFESGTLRFQVPLPPGLNALHWLQSQPHHCHLLPRSYFSPRAPRGNGKEETTASEHKKGFQKIDFSDIGGVAGVGSAVLFNGAKPFSLRDWKAMKRFLSKDHPIIRSYGAMRFNPETEPSEEWRSFGSFYFFIPQIELCECEGCSLLAVNLAWDNAMGWSLMNALRNSLSAIQTVSTRICPDDKGTLAQVMRREHVPDEPSWHVAVNKTLQLLTSHESDQSDADQPSPFQTSAITKVVMARRTTLEMDDEVDPLSILACLQEKDSSAYQFAIQVPDGSAFIGSSPERLFARDGLLVASEAVAGTRARGSGALKDLQLGMELLLSTKDHVEFDIVRESVKRCMEMVCKYVETGVHKSLIKQGRVQHLYARFNGELNDEVGEFDLWSGLHPTPAVCGHPQEIAQDTISISETFDRGLYAGPVGWFGGNGSEFAVGIRSSLIQSGTSNGLQVVDFPARSQGFASDKTFRSGSLSEPGDIRASPTLTQPQVSASVGSQETNMGTRIFLYAGVGVVKDSNAASEWRELELKTSQFETLLEPSQPLEKVVNINALWAKLIVEECCRLGITYFCIAPGSRSSPLTAAAAANPRITCISCIDERSMAFHALGYGRGANKAAAIVTSSGTAVSNLLPAVVEASQDFVPLLVLSADRPPDLQDTGANQTIDQGKHFGGFVRYHANLPAADDKLPARMVLTTIDAAVNKAMSTPSGPVHINCSFSEPLAGIAESWNTICLKGLGRWVATANPYTQYIDSKPKLLGGMHPTYVADLEGIAKLLDNSREGLIVVGGLSAAEETWAVALLAKHLGWPVVPDIVSGLRVGKVFCSGAFGDRKVNIIHNFDQVLLSSSVVQSSRPDVVLQIGSRLTSKRLSKFLGDASPGAYILVEEHSSRHDPTHVVTHRVQCSATDFSYTIINATRSQPTTAFCVWLQMLSEVVQREIHRRLQAESSLTEPFVAHYVVSCLPSGSALFLGNSMPIRDTDMYAHGGQNFLGGYEDDNAWDQSIPHLGARVGANRGASGIDGVLSTAIGFAAGSRQRVTLLVGDLSFLHDTNGLTLLSERAGQPPVTVVVVNNRGGGIFSLLPVASTLPEASFTTFFSTPHRVDLQKLCEAHNVDYWLTRTKEDLKRALQVVQWSPLNCVIEVESKIEENTDFHRLLGLSIAQSVTRAFHVLSMFPFQQDNISGHGFSISGAEFFHFRFSLRSPPTTRLTQNSSGRTKRKGFLLRVTLSNGASAIGEISPLEGLHEETLLDVEEQLRVVIPKLQGLHLHTGLSLLDGSFADWLSKVVGVPDNTLFPSVCTGIEMAVLGALAASRGCSLYDLFSGFSQSSCSPNKSSSPTLRICGLLDSEGTPEDVAYAAAQLVTEGFCTLKLKVGRRFSPLDDAAVLKLVRKRVGSQIHLRADANRKWSLQEAITFAKAVQNCGLQYLEEPVKDIGDLPQFWAETGLPVALDESLDEDPDNLESTLQTYARAGVVAAVIKPSRVGGFEKASKIVQWVQLRGMTAVISSAFESSISLAAFSQFAAFVDEQRQKQIAPPGSCPDNDKIPTTAHGLGTYKWLSDDPLLPVKLNGNSVEICIRESAAYLQQMHLNMDLTKSRCLTNHLTSYFVNVDCPQGSYSFHVKEYNPSSAKSVGKIPSLLFLHGFLGCGEDWLPIMDALSLTFRCISVDLPGHGYTTVEDPTAPAASCSELEERDEGMTTLEKNDTGAWSIEGLALAFSGLLEKLSEEKVIFVGYSMGARFSLYMALKWSQMVSAAVIVSGTPGLDSFAARELRAAQDDALAVSLSDGGLLSFLDSWYRRPLWKSLVAHPDFELIKRARLEHQDVHNLAKSLSSFSTGRQPTLWGDLAFGEVPLLLVVGKLDTKFVDIAHKMMRVCEHGFQSRTIGGEAVNGANPRVQDLGEAQSSDIYPAFMVEGMKDAEEQDAVPSEAVGSTMKRKNNCDGPRAELLEVEGCGHAVQIESPLTLVKAIREFALRLNCEVSHWMT